MIITIPNPRRIWRMIKAVDWENVAWIDVVFVVFLCIVCIPILIVGCICAANIVKLVI